LLSALAVTTHHIRLGTGVNCIGYRNPVLLARMAADVDRLSGGRLILGLGIGDFPLEFTRMGLHHPSIAERQQTLEDTIEVIKGVWGPTPFTYKTQYVQVEQCSLPAGPIQQPHVPLLIAGGGERVTLRQVAKYADASNFGEHPYTGSAVTLADVARKFEVLRAHCEQFGRPAEAVLRTHITLPLVLGKTPEAIAQVEAGAPPFLREMFRASTIAVTPDQAIVYYNALIQAGMQYFILVIWPNDMQTMPLFSKLVLPALVR
jgi:alkanesulfonate monooxygenase SsuD/methylene tetrahydromethanopterin reductase-like flavin-dependent oxidoreductase (luciferase family)